MAASYPSPTPSSAFFSALYAGLSAYLAAIWLANAVLAACAIHRILPEAQAVATVLLGSVVFPWGPVVWLLVGDLRRPDRDRRLLVWLERARPCCAIVIGICTIAAIAGDPPLFSGNPGQPDWMRWLRPWTEAAHVAADIVLLSSLMTARDACALIKKRLR